VAITAVEQGYEWTNIHYNYRIGSGITNRGMGKPIEIGRQRNSTEEYCHDLAKWLSHYFIFLFFSYFSFFWTYYTRKEYKKTSHDQGSQGHNHMTGDVT